MLKKLACAIALVAVAVISAPVQAQQKLFVYTSMKESMVGEIRDAVLTVLADE